MATFTIISKDTTNSSPYQIGTLYLNLEHSSVYVFTKTDFSTNTIPEYKDAENDPPLKIKILDISLENKGKLFLNGEEVQVEDEITMLDIENNLFTYVSDITTDIQYTDLFIFDIADEGSTEYGDLNGTINITVNEIENLPPSSVGDGEVTLEHGETLIFTREMFTTQTVPPYSDPEGDAALLLKITQLPTNGNLIFNETLVFPNQIINFLGIDQGLLIFQPDTSIKINNIENFTFQIADEGSGVFVG